MRIEYSIIVAPFSSLRTRAKNFFMFVISLAP
jgi:hypothetical protein